MIAVPSPAYTTLVNCVSSMLDTLSKGNVPSEEIIAKAMDSLKRVQQGELNVCTREKNGQSEAFIPRHTLTLTYDGFVAQYGESVKPMYPSWVSVEIQP